jgi:predicted negative regulator of RcsB-dependent stress response
MDAYATEEQQWEAVKGWFKKYGNTISWALIVILSIILAGQYWRHHKAVVRQEASENYMSLIMGAEQNDAATVKSKAQTLIDQYPGSPYAAFAALFLANHAVEAKELPNAEKQLQWVMAHSNQQLQALARTRLMRLKMAENKLDEALGLYDEGKADGFLTLMAELKGDILMKKNDKAGAQKAYEKALSAAPEENMHGPLLKMKLEALGSIANNKEGKKS